MAMLAFTQWGGVAGILIAVILHETGRLTLNMSQLCYRAGLVVVATGVGWRIGLWVSQASCSKRVSCSGSLDRRPSGNR